VKKEIPVKEEPDDVDGLPELEDILRSAGKKR
jgi:hypothetical protein